jgi:hypothetical protein
VLVTAKVSSVALVTAKASSVVLVTVLDGSCKDTDGFVGKAGNSKRRGLDHWIAALFISGMATNELNLRGCIRVLHAPRDPDPWLPSPDPRGSA